MTRFLNSLVLLVVLASCASKESPPSIVGVWLGDLVVNENLRLRVGCEFKLENDSLVGTMASIDQGAYGIQINSISIIGDTLVFAVNQMGVTYRGIFSADTSIDGHFVQGSSPPMVLNFTRAAAIPGAPPERHQYPRKPYPYHEEEIEFTSSTTGFTLAGTLTYPRKGGDYPAVLLIPGSGANDRDETIWGHKVFLVLADHLTRHGVVVLRMDDRGVGGSTGTFETASVKDFADDAREGILYLKSRVDLSIGKLGLIGHSLGADIAPLAANLSPDVSFVVLMAGSGITLAETIHFQTDHIYTKRGASLEAIALNRKINQTVFDIAAMDIDPITREQKLSQAFTILAPEVARLDNEDRQNVEIPEILKPEDYYGFFSENMRFDLFYNPADELEKLRIPILLLAGDLDTQVSANHNMQLMRQALDRGGNTQVTARLYPGVNHLFQTCSTGEIEEYNQIGETLSPLVLEDMTAWINSLK